MRGRDYLSDKRKQPSAEPAFRLKAMEAITTDAPVTHISPFLPVVAHSRAAFLLPVHFTLPYAGRLMHLVIVFEADADPTAEEGAAADGPFTRALAEFLTGTSPADDRRRNNTLKLIPMVRPAPPSSSHLPAADAAVTGLPACAGRPRGGWLQATALGKARVGGMHRRKHAARGFARSSCTESAAWGGGASAAWGAVRWAAVPSGLATGLRATPP